jgi:ATP-dependent helicase/nuclease subunit A
VSVSTVLRNDYAPPASDEAARQRILTDLDSNMLVEAGAGSGKTTSLIGRMHALVMSGEPVERIAAVTFTRKAANELRERFQIKLETELRALSPGSEAWLRCDRALHDIDRAFLGTVHSFCARILREHPLEIALDPNFAEVSESAWEELCRGFWARWLERCKKSGDAMFAGLTAIGVEPRSLYDGFRCVMKYSDVDFPLTESSLPDGAPCREKLVALIERARVMMPAEEPTDGWDPLMNLINRLEYHRRSNDWRDVATFCTALEQVTQSGCGITQKRWSEEKAARTAAKTLAEQFIALLDGEITALLTCWYEFRYPGVMRFLKHASADFARERHETGQLGFEDLLMLSSTLLREHSHVRDTLGERYRRLLVDEFQDTDPIQAEVCFLLASESSEGADWRRVTPRAGAIFLVGDPKQSIYRFRRADIQVYEFTKSRMAEYGVVLALTRNFRSVTSIGDFVNRYFQDVFSGVATEVQAPFTPMHAERQPGAGDGVSEYWVRPEKRDKWTIIADDSAQVASWIASRVTSGERVPGDFLVLTAVTAPLASYARALAARNIPVTTSGARLPQEDELTELLVVLRAIADPDNSIAVVAALEGMFFGCGPADLYDARVAGIRFRATRAPDTSDTAVARSLQQLHEWWKVSQRQAADVLLERILGDTGLLYFAASQTLGDARAGALLRLVETLRLAATSGSWGINDAMNRIELLLAEDSDDASLRPGRTDAVRVMNLHKAKGLEAKVVILAAPIPATDFPPQVHITRGESGLATGGIVVSSRDRTIAQPVGWTALADAERGFADAERERLRYVAATRAMSELVIARCEYPRAKSSTEDRPDSSAWSPFGDALTSTGRQTVMQLIAAPGRRITDRTLPEIAEAITAATRRVTQACDSSIRHRTVTESAREQREAARAYDLPRDAGRGAAWGRAVHRCIEAAGCGRTGPSLHAFAAAVASDEKLDGDQAAELEALIVDLQRSDIWKRLTRDGSARFELPVMHVSNDDAMPVLTEGVIDAATLTDNEWLVVDWKTDSASGDEWVSRKARYDRQVAAYEEILTALSQHPATSAIHRVLGSDVE